MAISDCELYKLTINTLNQMKNEFQIAYDQLFEDIETKQNKLYTH